MLKMQLPKRIREQKNLKNILSGQFANTGRNGSPLAPQRIGSSISKLRESLNQDGKFQTFNNTGNNRNAGELNLVYNGGERATTTNQQIRNKLIGEDLSSPQRRITTCVPGSKPALMMTSNDGAFITQ